MASHDPHFEKIVLRSACGAVHAESTAREMEASLPEAAPSVLIALVNEALGPEPREPVALPQRTNSLHGCANRLNARGSLSRPHRKRPPFRPSALKTTRFPKGEDPRCFSFLLTMTLNRVIIDSPF